MSALNFPDNPTPGQQYTDPNGKVWIYNGVVWNASIDDLTTGATGISGFSGNTGATGTSGFSGQDGTIGIDGATGATGISGFSGTSGFSGFSGISGFSGVTGASDSGTSGFSGYSGTQSNIAVSDQGNLLTSSVSSFNFVGDLVTATNVGGAVTVTVEEPSPVYENTIWMWGKNCFSTTPRGNLGNNSGLNSSSPVSVVGGFTDWSQLSAGSGHSLAIRQNGTAWAWGQNGDGRLGDNCATDRSSPVSVVGEFTDWSQLSAGGNFSLGVRQNGTAWAWGQGSSGQLGTGNSSARSSPVSVVGGFTDWCQVAAAIETSFGSGVRQNGTLYAWGYNTQGQLGDNTTVNKSSPVSVVGGFTDWCRISLAYHSIALRQNGTIWAWGRGACGRLGNNCTTNRSSPVSVIGGFCDWCQVSAGGTHSLAIRTNGSAWAWGQNSRGQLGISSYSNRSSPVSVVGGFTDWCQVSGSYQSSFGLRTNGTIFSWGRGLYGALGDNSTSGKNSPASISGGFTDWICLSYPQSGSFSSGAIRSTL